MLNISCKVATAIKLDLKKKSVMQNLIHEVTGYKKRWHTGGMPVEFHVFHTSHRACVH